MKKHHKLNYVEFTAEDLSAVKEFYSKAFGWTFTDYGPEYATFSNGETEGGFAKGTISKNGGVFSILYSENLEESVKTVEKHGGSIAKPIFSFPGGRRFHFKDPAGNHLAIWSDK